jgi:hypothetical protein
MNSSPKFSRSIHPLEKWIEQRTSVRACVRTSQYHLSCVSNTPWIEWISPLAWLDREYRYDPVQLHVTRGIWTSLHGTSTKMHVKARNLYVLLQPSRATPPTKTCTAGTCSDFSMKVNKVNQQLLDWIELWAFFGTLCRYAKQESNRSKRWYECRMHPICLEWIVSGCHFVSMNDGSVDGFD